MKLVRIFFREKEGGREGVVLENKREREKEEENLLTTETQSWEYSRGRPVRHKVLGQTVWPNTNCQTGWAPIIFLLTQTTPTIMASHGNSPTTKPQHHRPKIRPKFIITSNNRFVKKLIFCISSICEEDESVFDRCGGTVCNRFAKKMI